MFETIPDRALKNLLMRIAEIKFYSFFRFYTPYQLFFEAIFEMNGQIFGDVLSNFFASIAMSIAYDK